MGYVKWLIFLCIYIRIVLLSCVFHGLMCPAERENTVFRRIRTWQDREKTGAARLARRHTQGI
jgi:hypothetical protein